MDEIDKANELAEMELAARLTHRRPGITPTGFCLNCEEKLLPKQRLFCSIECREDWDRRGSKAQLL